jgi:hypothetical protein
MIAILRFILEHVDDIPRYFHQISEAGSMAHNNEFHIDL